MHLNNLQSNYIFNPTKELCHDSSTRNSNAVVHLRFHFLEATWLHCNKTKKSTLENLKTFTISIYYFQQVFFETSFNHQPFERFLCLMEKFLIFQQKSIHIIGTSVVPYSIWKRVRNETVKVIKEPLGRLQVYFRLHFIYKLSINHSV